VSGADGVRWAHPLLMCVRSASRSRARKHRRRRRAERKKKGRKLMGLGYKGGRQGDRRTRSSKGERGRYSRYHTRGWKAGRGPTYAFSFRDSRPPSTRGRGEPTRMRVRRVAAGGPGASPKLTTMKRCRAATGLRPSRPRDPRESGANSRLRELATQSCRRAGLT